MNMNRRKGYTKERGSMVLIAVGAVVALMMICNTLFSKDAPFILVPEVRVAEEQPREHLRSKSGATTDPPKIEMTKEDVRSPIVQKGNEMKLSQDIFNPENEVHNPEPDPDGMSPTTLKDHMLFHHYHKGKAGAVIEDMLMCHAYAFHHDAMYGGSCGEPSTKTQSHQDLLESIGLKNVLLFSCPADHAEDEHTRRSVIPQDNF
jgi:hypothetical protein